MTIEFATMPMTETWGRMVEYRLIGATASDGQKLGPVLQQAWRCRENGEIRWKTVPTVHLSPADFNEAAKDTET